jgi:probable rRNA maturation factor
LRISFHTTEKRYSISNKNKRRNWISACIKAEGFSIGTIRFIFCSDEFLLDINREFLKHDYLTDVITFSSSSSSLLNGEIYVSFDRVKENAGTYQVPFEEELNRVLIHGVLHLMDFDDSSKRQKLIMTAKENLFLAKF